MLLPEGICMLGAKTLEVRELFGDLGGNRYSLGNQGAWPALNNSVRAARFPLLPEACVKPPMRFLLHTSLAMGFGYSCSV